ncbi:MAG TPA: hypothetical protein H9858_07770 [Candidatus Blautia stercoravium]|nr:hypothetical protein [Candidatus Blautia stercoravium]
MRRKPWIKMIFYIVVMLMIFWIPEISVFVGIGIFVSWFWRKIKHMPIGTFRIKRK